MKSMFLICGISGMILISCAQGSAKKDIVTEQQQLQQEQLNLEKQKLEFQKQQMQFQEKVKADSLASIQRQPNGALEPTNSGQNMVNSHVTSDPAPAKVRTRIVYRQESAETPARKPGMSARAKDAIIGGAVGATAGAIIPHKGKGLGAVIGGVVGAGTGYTIGKAHDRKTGRL